MSETITTTRLINADAVRKQIKRLFSGSLREIFGELMQNAQRAGAKKFIVTTESLNDQTSLIHVHDDGKGIEDFEKLLVIGDSNWSETVNANQEPMGLGIQALLAHEEVSAVTIRSKGNWLTIDTKRWWDDLNYASNWKRRFGADPQPISDTILTIHCAPKFAAQVENVFEICPPEIKEDRFWEHTGKGVARGYADFLTVTVNNKPAPTEPIAITALKSPIIVDTFEGCPLYIGSAANHTNNSTGNVINWYGQLIHFGQSNFPFYLLVKSGKPIDLKAPTRQGPIQNAKLQALYAHVKQLLWDHFTNPANQKELTLLKNWLGTLKTEERQALSFTVDAEWSEPHEWNDAEDFDAAKNLQFVSLTDDILFLDSQITIKQNEEVTYTADVGVTTFLPLTGKAYQASSTIHSHLPIKTVWWEPGEELTARGEGDTSFYAEGGVIFTKGGRWGFGTEDEEPKEWQPIPVTESPLMAVIETNPWDVDNSFIFVSNIEPLTFYQEDWPRAAFAPDYESGNYEHQRDSFDDSIARNVRELIGNCVKRNFEMWDIEAFAPKDTQVTNIAIHENEKKQRCLTVTFSDGSTKELTTQW